jgi:ABC-type antimicrobial peptide transport system permease subunit
MVTVVGIVGTIRHSSLYAEPRPQMYWLNAQAPADQIPYQAVIAVRTGGDPASFADEARAAIHEVDRDQPLTNVRTMGQVVSDSVSQRRFSLMLLGLFALLALALAVVGIYGVTAYSVAQRTREMGLRIALGAQPKGVIGLVMGEAGVLAGIGVVLGVIAAFAATRLLSARLSDLLYQVHATDPLTFVAVALGLTLVALLAAWVPGRRATRVDPIIALRGE